MEVSQDAGEKIHNSGHFQAEGNAYVGNSFKADTINFGQNGGIEHKRAAIARALTYHGIDIRRTSIEWAASRSLDWIWETEFSTWLKGDDDVCWITGKAGSGKSTMMKFLSESKKTRHLLNSNGQRWSILHFFFDFRFGTGIANTPEGMLRSMLLQMVRKSESATDNLQALNAPEQFQPDTLDKLLQATMSILENKQGSHCIFIDGIDEYQGELSQLIPILLRLIEQTTAKFILASRPLAKIDAALQGRSCITMQDHNYKTIHAYLSSINLQLELDLKTICPSQVLEAIIQRADGVILWARFAIENILIGCAEDESIEQLERRVALLPPLVDEMYESTLARIPSRLLPEAALYLYFISRGEDRITTLELRAFAQTITVSDPVNFHVPRQLSLHQFTKRLMTLFGGLINIHERNARYHIDGFATTDRYWGAANCPKLKDYTFLEVTLVHETMKAYLTRTGWVHTRLKMYFQGNIDMLTDIILCATLDQETAISTQSTELETCIQRWKSVSSADPGALRDLLYAQREGETITSERLLLILSVAKIFSALLSPDHSADHLVTFQRALTSPWVFAFVPLCMAILPYHQLYEKGYLDLFWALMNVADRYFFTRLSEMSYLDAPLVLDAAITSITDSSGIGWLNSPIFDQIISPLVLLGLPMLDCHLVALKNANNWYSYDDIDPVKLRKASRFELQTNPDENASGQCQCGLSQCPGYNGFYHFIEWSDIPRFEPLNSQPNRFVRLLWLYQQNRGTINMPCWKHGTYLRAVAGRPQKYVGERLYKVVVGLAAGATPEAGKDVPREVTDDVGGYMHTNSDKLRIEETTHRSYRQELLAVEEILQSAADLISDDKLDKYAVLARKFIRRRILV